MGDRAPAPEPIQWLGDAIGGSDLLGGKAASIDRLARLGVATPPGFCVTTDAFRRELLDGPMRDATERALANLPDEGARQGLVAMATDAPLSRELGSALTAALDRLDGVAAFGADGPARLAVRSSAVGEDGAFSSFAGMHDSELGVTRDEVVPALRRCWASLWSDRAIGYRQLRGLPLDGGAMAVVVQALVPASAAAVVFTRHPVTGRADQLMVNAVIGLGDSIVSGDVTPDMYVLEKDGMAVCDREIAGRGALDDRQLRELAELSLHVEDRFGQPVDLEAAYADGRWYLLQARPITTH
jgi:phosphoenolpyruvate synthase/pyruvate phosphate dikinase